MKRKALFNIAASSLIIASTMVGCSGAALNTRAGTSAGKLEQMADAQARAAESALADKDAAKSIQLAEAAVAANPDKADYRTLLGRAYLLDGRFDSARTAFEDALALGSTDVRTIVNLSLVNTALGRHVVAQQILVDQVDVLPAADYGLAMAMAGNAEEAVRVLSRAIHDPAAGAKERQNLAYSYALAGRWEEARQMAEMDLSPLDAANRVLGWAQIAQPGAESQRVIAMMGVSPRVDDAGLPVRLALGQPHLNVPIRDVPSQMAEVTDQPGTVAGQLPVQLAALELPDDAPSANGAQQALEGLVERVTPPAAKPVAPARADTRILNAKPAMLAKAEVPASRPATRWQPVDPASGSAWVVQLGAFSSPAAAKVGWKTYQRRNAAVSEFPMIISSAVVGGQEYHRMAIAGFAGRKDANSFCLTIRANGGKCFVREGGAEAAPAVWAQALKKKQQLAMK